MQSSGFSPKWASTCGIVLNTKRFPSTLTIILKFWYSERNFNTLKYLLPHSLPFSWRRCCKCSFTGNDGLCGIPGLPSCGPHLSVAAKIGIAFGVLIAFLLLLVFFACWWKRRQNILRAQKIAACKELRAFYGFSWISIEKIKVSLKFKMFCSKGSSICQGKDSLCEGRADDQASARAWPFTQSYRGWTSSAFLIDQRLFILLPLLPSPFELLVHFCVISGAEWFLCCCNIVRIFSGFFFLWGLDE